MAMSRNEYGEVEIEVTITRSNLLDRLRTNREQHAKLYAIALELWQADLTVAFSTLKSESMTGWPEELDDLEGDCPESHLHEYDRAIDMFEICVTEEITLDSTSFNKFCRDEWNWKSDSASNSYFRDAAERLKK